MGAVVCEWLTGNWRQLSVASAFTTVWHTFSFDFFGVGVDGCWFRLLLLYVLMLKVLKILLFVFCFFAL